jgi:hypothetical protein
MPTIRACIIGIFNRNSKKGTPQYMTSFGIPTLLREKAIFDQKALYLFLFT